MPVPWGPPHAGESQHLTTFAECEERAATFDPRNGQLCLLMLNRDLQADRELALDCRDFTPTRVLASETLTRTSRLPIPSGGPPCSRPARSYSVAHLATS